jgi:hypothetical protein
MERGVTTQEQPTNGTHVDLGPIAVDAAIRKVHVEVEPREDARVTRRKFERFTRRMDERRIEMGERPLRMFDEIQ